MSHPGNKLVHAFNPEFGTGLVVEVSGRFLKVYCPLDIQLANGSTA